MSQTSSTSHSDRTMDASAGGSRPRRATPWRARCASALVFACASASLAPLTGCQGGGLDGVFNKAAIDLLAPALKDAANSYVGNLSALTSSLGSLNSYSDAIKFLEKLEPQVKQLTNAYNTLTSASPQDRKLLLEAFGPKFDSTNTGFLNQVGVAKGKSGWGQLLGPALEQIKLFK